MIGGSAKRVVVEFFGSDRTLGREFNDMETRGSRVAGILGKVGKAAAIGLAVGITTATVAGVKFAQMAIEDQQSAAAMAQQFKANANATDEQIAATERWITKQGQAKGVADDELRPALAALISATKDVGQAQDLTSLAMDTAAARGKSLQTVSEALMKAHNGNIGALGRLGVNTKNAAGETITFEQAVARMSDQFGGAAATHAETLGGKMDRLKVILSEAGEAIGYKLLPVATTMATFFLNNVIPAISQASDWAQLHLVPALRDIGDWIQVHVLPALQDIGTWISQHVLPAFTQLGANGPGIFSQIAGIVSKAGEVFTLYAGTIVHVAGIVAERLQPVFDQLVATFQSSVLPTVRKLYERLEEWWPTINKVTTKVAELAGTILGTLLPPVIKFAGYLLEHLVPAVLDTIEILAKIVGGVYDTGAAFVDAIGNVGQFVSAAKEKIGKVLEAIKGIPGDAKAALGDLGGLLLHAGEQIISGLIQGIQNKLNDLKGMLSSVTNLIPDWKGPLDKDKVLLTPAGEALIEGLIDGINKRKQNLQSVLTKVTDYVAAKRDKLKDLLSQRDSFAAGFSSFGSSIFGADISGGPVDENGNPTGPVGVDAMKAFSDKQRAEAERLEGDVKNLLGKGISKELLQQLAAQGEAGKLQIHALAGADQATIEQFNVNNAATQAALQAAGMLAANDIYGQQIRDTKRDEQTAENIVKALDRWADKQDKNTTIQIVLDSDVIHASLLKKKRRTGQNLGLG